MKTKYVKDMTILKDLKKNTTIGSSNTDKNFLTNVSELIRHKIISVNRSLSTIF